MLGAGCATDRVLPPSADLRADFKLLGVVAPNPRSLSAPDEPVKGAGEGALAGAGQGAWGTFGGTAYGFCSSGGPLGCAFGVVLGAVLAPVGGVIGAGVGAARAHPAEEVGRAHETLVAVLEKMRPNEDLVSRFVEEANGAYGIRTVSVDCAGHLSGCTVDGEAAPKYVLRLEYASYVLGSTGRIEPDVTIAAAVHGQIFDPSGGEVVYERRWGYRSEKVGYFDLSEDEGGRLAKVIAGSHREVASAVARDLFRRTLPTPIETGAAGTVWTISGPLAKAAEPVQPPSGRDDYP